MSRLSDVSIYRLCAQVPYEHQMISPFVASKMIHCGMSFGLSGGSYDFRIAQTCVIPPKGFMLASSLELFRIPSNVQMDVYDKSTWARAGLAVQNTLVDAGFRGHLTLELSNHLDVELVINAFMPIAQGVFTWLDGTPWRLYNGKYQDQPNEPVPPIYEGQQHVH